MGNERTGDVRILLGTALLAFFGILAGGSQESWAGRFNPGVARRIVVFHPSTRHGDRIAIIQGAGATMVRELPLINAVVIEGAEARIMDVGSGLSGRPEVLRVDADPVRNWLLGVDRGFGEFKAPSPAGVAGRFAQGLSAVSPRAGPRRYEDPAAGQSVPWGITRVDAPKAWPKTRGSGAKVCVVDTGIDATHPDLKANVKGGWNVISNSADFADDHGHGTHVSGTIAAVDNNIGVVGVAPQVSLYGVKVLDAEGAGTDDDVIAGMQWCVQNHMDVVSMSLGGDVGSESLKEAVAAMAKAGVVLVAAAGNSGGPVGYPAGYPGAIAIAAMDSSDGVAYFSSRGPQVAFIAPGVAVLSTFMGGGYKKLSGTSMATPHVSGLAALAISARGIHGVRAVRAALRAAATPLAGASSQEQGAGVIDAAGLVGARTARPRS